MKIKVYLDKLGNSQEYKDFTKEHSDAYLIAGFFVIDLEAGKNINQIDYYIPSKKKVAAFTLDNHVHVQILKTMNNSVPPKLDLATKIDLDAIPGILEDEMKNRSITEEIKKIVAIIQNIDGKKIWNINCVLSGMSILKAHIEDESKSVLKMEKSSILDYIQKLPMPQQAGQPGGQQIQIQPQSAQSVPPQNMQVSPAAAKDQIEKLNKLEEAIEKEKARIKKEVLDEEAEESKKKARKSSNKKSKK
ncbi:MAG: hypothetical protein Q8L29_03685 [archaeon]|nr:hypothetical protein [archaeon]